MSSTSQKRAMRIKRLFHVQRGTCAGCGEPMRLHLVNARLMSEPSFRWHWEQCDAR